MVTKLGLLSCVVALVGCNERDEPATPAPAAATPLAGDPRPDQTVGGTVIPQSHEFPPGRAGDIRRLFDRNVMSYPISVISAQGAQTQFVNPRPVFIGDHRFVVGAPPAMHAAIDRMIASLDKSGAPVSATYEVTFWVVEATAATNVDVARDLVEVAPMLEKLGGIGKRRYRSLDRVAARSRDGAETKLAGRMIKVEHSVAAFPDGIELDLELSLTGTWSEKPEQGPKVETKLQLPLDQAIVIGDSAQTAGADGAANLLLYVVRARRVD
jgi:hypothetical protein